MTRIILFKTFKFILCVFLIVVLVNKSFCTIDNFNEYYLIDNHLDDFLDNIIVEPIEFHKQKNNLKKTKRSIDLNDEINDFTKAFDNILNSKNKVTIKVEDWIFVLEENKYISFGEEIWVKESEEKKFIDNLNDTECKFYTGNILYESDSTAIVTICDKKYYYGFFTTYGKSYIIEPIDEPCHSHIVYKAKLLHEIDDKGELVERKDDIIVNGKSHVNTLSKINKGKIDEHSIETSNNINTINFKKVNFVNANENEDIVNKTTKKTKRELVDESRKVFNLTGDTILDDINYNFADEEVVEIDKTKETDSSQYEDEKTNNNYDYYDYDLPLRTSVKWNKIKWKQDEEDVGYFVDAQWQTRPYIKTMNSGSSKSSKTERWLEIAIAVDYTVIEFHGKAKIKQYIMALMNIVSAIYKDASLDANLHLVMSRLIFYDDKKDSVIRQGYAKKSLEDVNRWNYKFIGRLAPYEKPHDVAVWITREYLGGPSGYAPVAGVCDRSRSTALNKDEGLASAFIIAHEMAHIIGLSHDGDLKAGNKCYDEVVKGTIMAPTVSANFNRFTWSSCSKEEFHRLIKQWHCLLNPPEGKNHTVITPGTTESFTMDEQCRMEYGEGYALCRNFELIEPCTHLWCGQKESLQCITKKGAPAEGTQCGFDKWCVGGYCQSVDGRLYGTGILRSGGWGQWSEWSKCSRPCGYGVRIRRRSCDNPSPAWGGAECEGLSEEKEICHQNRQCWDSPTSDQRADKCNALSKDGRLNGTWLPYEADDDEDLSCSVSCMSWETGEVIRSKENVPDGTPCTYDNLHHICLDGECKKLGCDGKEGSTVPEDKCGVCGGNGDTCFESHLHFNKTQKKNMTRLLVLPRHSRNIHLRVTLHLSLESNRIVPLSLFHLVLRNKHKKLFKIDSRNGNDLFDITKSSSDISSSVWSGYRVGPSIVIAGSAFIVERPPGMLKLSVKGPLHSDVVVMLNSPSEYLFIVDNTVEANYTLGKEDVGRYKWVLEEHIPCQCGVVPRPPPIYCVDTRRGNRTVHGSHCLRVRKPHTKPQNCNLSCEFHWIPGPWESCTAACGKNGTKHRQTYCVPVSLGAETPISKLVKFMVEPKYCTKEKPLDEEPCNVIPCPVYWVEGPWTKCSSVCGPGVSTRPLVCESENSNECGNKPPLRWRSCRSKCSVRQRPYLAYCNEDRSPFCALPNLYRYCVIPSYRKLCCFTCKDTVSDYRENYI